MGICHSITSNKQKQKRIRKISNNSNLAKKEDSLIAIANKTNEVVIKTINQMNGGSLLIENNEKSVIIILDYTIKVMIVNCIQCSIYIAPCITDILISNCKNINIISASSDISINNVYTGNFFLFTKNSPVIEQSFHINLGIFCLQYTELPDIFRKANLNIWQNSWSQYIQKETPSMICNIATTVHFIDEEVKREVIKSFTIGHSDIIISFDQYQSHPFQYGKRITDKELKSMSSVLLVLKDDFLNDNYKEVLNIFSNEELKEKRTMLLKTNIISEDKKEYVTLKEKIMDSGNEYLMNYFNNVNLASNTKILKGNSQFCFMKTFDDMNKINQLNKNEVLVMWLVNDVDNYEEFQKYIEKSFDDNSIGWIVSEDIKCDEKGFQDLLKELVF